MSNPRKDAAWFLALQAADSIGLTWENIKYEGHVELLEEAGRILDKNPDDIERYAKEFNRADPH